MLKASSDEEDNIVIEGMASTDDVDRMGDVIVPAAWNKGLKNFKANPVILFNHNYDNPIGKATGIKIEENGLYIKAKISKTAEKIGGLIKEGVLGAFSVGFRVKDAEWDDETDGLKITDAELLEVSVVSVPANQAAVFSVSKSFNTKEDYFEYLKSFNSVSLAGQQLAEDSNEETAKVTPEGHKAKVQEINMEPTELEELIGKAVQAAAEKAATETAKLSALARAEEKAAEEKAAKDAVEAEEKANAEKEQLSVVVTTAAEKLMEGVEKRFSDEKESLDEIVASLRGELAEKSEEIVKIRQAKGIFADRSGNGDWKKTFENDIVEGAILGRVTKKGWDTDFGKDVVQKVNQHSGVEVSSEDFEQIVSTSIERDIELELVLPKLFREIQMRSATMILPIMPDADYAEFGNGTNGDTSDAGSAPKGNLDSRDAASPGVNAGIAMTEKILSVKRVVSKSYLGNETEEDAILPILPLIRESMVRAHSRAMEQSILNGGAPSSPARWTDILNPGWTGLLASASADSKEVDAGATAAHTAAMLLNMRQAMGKYGKNPRDVVYILSLPAYYNLLDDAEFQNLNEVGQMATKITGEIGQVFGSPVIVCDEFATAGVNVAWGLALNARNYIMPRLRGFTFEQDYLVEDQRRVLVATQRVGFDRIHSTAGQAVSSYFSS